MICKACGAEIADGSKFCNKCGQPIAAAADKGQAKQQNAPVPPPAAYPGAGQQRNAAAAYPGAGQQYAPVPPPAAYPGMARQGNMPYPMYPNAAYPMPYRKEKKPGSGFAVTAAFLFLAHIILTGVLAMDRYGFDFSDAFKSLGDFRGVTLFVFMIMTVMLAAQTKIGYLVSVVCEIACVILVILESRLDTVRICLAACWLTMFLITLLSVLLSPTGQNGFLKAFCYVPAILILVVDFYYYREDLDLFFELLFEYHQFDFVISVLLNVVEALALLFAGMWLASVKRKPQYGNAPYMNR